MDVLAATPNPANIARVAIRQLVASQVAPTPENFARAYSEVAGSTVGVTDDADAEQVLNHLVKVFASNNPKLASALQLKECVVKRDWNNARKAIKETLEEAVEESARDWPRLLQQLLVQLDITHAYWTRARKLNAVRHVLTQTSDGRAIATLDKLMSVWAQKVDVDMDAGGVAIPAVVNDEAAVSAVSPNINGTVSLASSSQSAEVRAWRLLALTALDVYQPAGFGQQNKTAGRAVETLGARLASHVGIPGAEWRDEIQSACNATQAEIYRQAAFRDRLVKLLRLLCENLTLFADEDAWVNGQVARITELLNSSFDERALSEAEDSLHAAVKRQAQLKAELTVAKAAVKEMLTSLIDYLADAATNTDEFHIRIGARAEAIKAADDMPSLSRVVATLLDDALEMRDTMQRTHGELSAARDAAQKHEARVHALETELVEVSSMVRIDPLTQALNRRGLEEAMTVEQSRADRDGAPLAVALLDIDNFKRVNDSFGHQTGDKALKHVSDMVRSALRPGDTVARYGGEEFVILLPATTVAEAVKVLTRAQRQLTRNFFLHNEEKILITFSVGLAGYRTGESYVSVIKRADDAVYVAKAAGKNRVHVA